MPNTSTAQPSAADEAVHTLSLSQMADGFCEIRRAGRVVAFWPHVQHGSTMRIQRNHEHSKEVFTALNSHAALVAALEKIASRKTRTGLQTLPGVPATTITEPAYSQGEMMEIATAALNAVKG